MKNRRHKRALLKRMLAEIRSCFWIFNPEDYGLTVMKAFEAATVYGEAMYSGEIGYIEGFRIIESPKKIEKTPGR